jgi:hypothetical protein
MIRLIWTLVAVLLLLWLLGLIARIGGGLIHFLLFLAIVGIVYNLLVRRGAL